MNHNTDIQAAVAGDRDAVERLLRQCFQDLEKYVSSRVPADLNSVLSSDEVLQETLVDVFRSIGNFDPSAPTAFEGWVQSIAEHRLLDCIRYYRRQKRGGNFQRKENASYAFRSSVKMFVATLAEEDNTPSQFVARDEAIDGIRIAIAGLSDEQRTAITLHCLMHRSIEDTATIMNTTAGSVRGLVHRGKQTLRTSLQESVKWLSKKG